jgi:hypothetical protein
MTPRLASALLLFAAPVLVRAAVIHQTDFETNPIAGGWGSQVPLDPAGNDWTTAQSFSPIHSIRAQAAAWYTPVITLDPFELYAVSYRAKADAEGTAGSLTFAHFPYVANSGWNLNHLLFRGEHSLASTRVLFFPPPNGSVYVDDARIESVTGLEAAAVLDAMYSGMPGFPFAGEPSRHDAVPETVHLLEQARTLRVVLLGDSIVNDTSQSYFEALVERLYPGSRIEVVRSVRGSTGCWWYRETEPSTGIPRVETWVTDYEPHLVMIGGISHGAAGEDYEIASIRDVMQQVWAIDPAVEFVLMTELAGTNDPYLRPDLLQDLDPDGSSWRSKLHDLAVDQGVGFLDMTGPWAQYIVRSGNPYSWFLRDTIHMNGRGALVAGRILEAFFAPSTPDTDADGVANPLDACPFDPDNDVDGDLLCAGDDPDDDGDSVGDVADCAPQDPRAWNAPGEVSPCAQAGGPCLSVTKQVDSTHFAWSAPAGGSVFWYDVVRANGPTAFPSAVQCVEHANAVDEQATETPSPGLGQLWCYLVRASNVCGAGVAGYDSAGTPISPAACPD